jgi:hypothetical protein
MEAPSYGRAGEIREHPTGPEHAVCSPQHAQRQAYREPGLTAMGRQPSCHIQTDALPYHGGALWILGIAGSA